MPLTLSASARTSTPVARPALDPAWTLLMISKHVALHRHLPRLTAAERILFDLPLHDARFAFDVRETEQLILGRLE